MASNNRLKAFVRYDGSGRVIAGSLILQRFKPKVGNWVEIDAYECCNPTTTTTTSTTAGPTTTTTTTSGLFSGTVSIGYSTCENQEGSFLVTGNGTTFCNSTELYSAGFTTLNDTLFVSFGGQYRIIQNNSTTTGILIGACETCP